MKIIILDLDDTIYDFKTFYYQAFINISLFLSSKSNVKQQIILKNKLSLYKKNSLNVIDEILKKLELKKIYKKKCISIYRYSKKKISTYNDAEKFLISNTSVKYLVTDGNKKVQKKKIITLKIKKYFKKIYITNQYGLKYNKPSLYCFSKIKKIEKCDFTDMYYIADNPLKDFINLKKVKIKTIRLMRGTYKNLKISKKYDADHKIKNFIELANFL
jgi:putative hydrolase of the HAD superfamily